MKEFECAIKSLDSYIAWYVARIYYQGRTYQFPNPTSETLRFDRRMRRTPGYRVRPFEFPIVPFAQIYTVELFDENGLLLPKPRGFGEFELVPLMRISVDSGLLLPPHGNAQAS